MTAARLVLLLAAVSCLSGRLLGQTAARAPGGTLTGLVQDSATGRPVAYALVVVVGKEQRVFASESGRFVLIGLGSGRLTIRVQQIGYRAVTLALTVSTDADGSGGAPGLVVPLVRRPVILPEIVVQGDVCTGSLALGTTDEGESVIDEALKGAERLLVLEKSYPFRAMFEQHMSRQNSEHQDLRRWIDTMVFDSRSAPGYRRGRVLTGPRGPYQVANYFTTSDLAREEFRNSHCFWYAGRDTSRNGSPAHRIDFAPLAKAKSADWAGSLLIDSATMMLTQSRARLVNLKANETTFTAAECTVWYRPIVPTLILEAEADCASSRSGGPSPHGRERWLLLGFGFAGKSPVANGPP